MVCTRIYTQIVDMDFQVGGYLGNVLLKKKKN